MDGKDGIVLIQFSRQQMFDTERSQQWLKLIELRRKLPFETGITAFLCQIQKGRHIAQFALNIVPLLEFTLQLHFLSANARRGACVAPEIRLSHLGFEFLKVSGHAGEVKDAP
jgi:hypothetical protein